VIPALIFTESTRICPVRSVFVLAWFARSAATPRKAPTRHLGHLQDARLEIEIGGPRLMLGPYRDRILIVHISGTAATATRHDENLF